MKLTSAQKKLFGSLVAPFSTMCKGHFPLFLFQSVENELNRLIFASSVKGQALTRNTT